MHLSRLSQLKLLPGAPMLTEAQRKQLRKLTDSRDRVIATQAVSGLAIATVSASERLQNVNTKDARIPVLR